MVPFLIVVALLVVVFGVVASPWRWSDGSPHRADDRIRELTVIIEDLEAGRDAKYREIRDAELDQQTHKISDDDFSTADAALRAEAVEILKQLDRAQTRLAKLQKQLADGVEPDGSDAEPDLTTADPDLAAARSDVGDGDEQLPSSRV